MNNKNKIFSDLSKIATDALGTISGIRKEVDTIVKIKIEKVVNKYDLVRRKEFEILKKMYEKQSKKIKELEKIVLAMKLKKKNTIIKKAKKR
tara:strand:- start:542 stop:817 length:276 start_codon:yes stop_codon:yes gene_type:complete